MGIPGMYRWLTDRYPNTLCCVVEDHLPANIRRRTIDNTDRPNPNGVEFDNLYIDMNGIIHPCFHPEGLTAPQSYDEVFKFIFEYIQRVFSIVRPRKLLYLAVDGVAPQAKMNHQRIRRFRAAKEAASKIGAVEAGKLDPNVITPGTEFMELLCGALKCFVQKKMEADPGWQGIKVILSDSSVVGEGEHKIFTYIRSQRNLPGYDPNTRHCVHGLDADLIMLALATHEIHFSILREIFTFGQNHLMKRFKRPSYKVCMNLFFDDLKFEFFNIWLLREYLEIELLVPNAKGTDFDRLIDDFVLICIFAGNDFLPSLPSLDISKGGIELLLTVYQQEFVKMGYLTDSHKVNLKSLEHFLQALSSHENAIFMKRSQVNVATEKTKKRKMGEIQDSDDQPKSITAPDADDVKIHKNLKQGYYTDKFECQSDDIERISRDAVYKYTEGVCWVMHYYYKGVAAWQWFYPYHYAPLASDFCGLDKLKIDFPLGQPFKPLDQLLGVLPAPSAHALPLFYRELMTKESSPILDLYPLDAKICRNGKRHAWQGVCLLPFMDSSRLLTEIAKVEHTLSDEEKQRNRVGKHKLFVNSQHPLAIIINKINPTSHVHIKPEISGGMNGYLSISGQPVRDNLTDKVLCCDYECPSQHHIPKLLSGVKMPPRILRCKDTLQPIAVCQKSQTKKKKGNKNKRKREQDPPKHPNGKQVQQDVKTEEQQTERENVNGGKKHKKKRRKVADSVIC